MNVKSMSNCFALLVARWEKGLLTFSIRTEGWIRNKDGQLASFSLCFLPRLPHEFTLIVPA